jgi:hypothetical protein
MAYPPLLSARLLDVPTFVYAIGCGDFIKIGIARDTAKRLSGLGTSSPYDLVLLARRQFPTEEIARFIEGMIHYQLGDQWHRGEWFRREPKDPIAELVRQYDMARDFYEMPEVTTLLSEDTKPGDPQGAVNELVRTGIARFRPVTA